MEFGLMFFSSYNEQSNSEKYNCLIKSAKFADSHGFSSIWTPERHFDEFGGIFSNPAITTAALAMVTKRIRLCAGSLVSPLHDELRIAEEWSMVDNLSQGRVAVSFGSGWNVNDFIFYPDRYANRQAVMYDQIKTIDQLWRGEAITRKNSMDKNIEIKIYPKPLQAKLPIWITSSGNKDTFISAGNIGANILTHMIGQDINSLAEKIRAYRMARANNNLVPNEGTVTLMLHTFLSDNADTVKTIVRKPFKEYLSSAIKLETKAAKGGGAISGGHQVPYHEISPDMMEELLDVTFERYFNTAALMGTPENCVDLMQKFEAIGVDEIACLLDFGIDEDTIISNLKYLNDFQKIYRQLAR